MPKLQLQKLFREVYEAAVAEIVLSYHVETIADRHMPQFPRPRGFLHRRFGIRYKP